MDRPLLLLIAVALAVYGLWTGLQAILLLGTGATALLMLLRLAQGVLALAAAYGVARTLAWAPALLLLLAVLIAVTLLIEAFVFGIRPWLYALLLAVGAIGLALAIGALLRGQIRRA